MTWNRGLSRIHFPLRGSIRRREGAILPQSRIHRPRFHTIVGHRETKLAHSDLEDLRSLSGEPLRFSFSRGVSIIAVCYETTKSSCEPRLEACVSPRRPPQKCLEAEGPLEMLSSKRAQSNTISLELRRTLITPWRWLSRSSVLKPVRREGIYPRESECAPKRVERICNFSDAPFVD